jgi:hypothetical protein
MLTPHQAAAHAKVSRGTIMNALKDGALIGFRDNRNRWQIKPDDLAKWLSERTVNASAKAHNSDTLKIPAIDEKDLRIAVLEAELKGERQRIFDLAREFERERSNLERAIEDWKAQAQELARRDIPKAQPEPPPPRRSWWPWSRS